ncbi:hypothetical protein Dvina_15285 [Dactylosporangium vinaceum]|uniref:DUF3592 domain-containing protein n=1 Tax=Dactylosporangium vinaceum TaxID=53362 RepID=A0ABV5M253_9ACTN|nr:hypothetical protein [Dactylosporangium vinaceum]UAB99315.1 hypothetical protein Dvina_15285 [Dactylosporangium vinaceum]
MERTASRAVEVVGAYVLLVGLLGVVGWLSFHVVRSAQRAALSEGAGPCTAAGQRDCRSEAEVAVVRRASGGGAEGDDVTYSIVTGPDGRSVTVDRAAYDALRAGDRVRLVSFDGEITHVVYSGGEVATGEYSDRVTGYTWLLWMAAPLCCSAAWLTVTLHRTGEFEGYLMFGSAVITALFSVVLALPLHTGLAWLIGAVPAAFTGVVLLAAATSAGWVRCTRPAG